MIQRTEVINVELTPREIESEVWNMDSRQQADLLLAMSQRYASDKKYGFQIQLLNIRAEIDSLLNDEEKENLIQMLENILNFMQKPKEI